MTVPAALRPWLKTAGVPLASLHAGCFLAEVRPVDRLGHVRAPVLIVHCEEDALIPPEHARRLYRAAAEPKRIFTAHTGGHTGVIYLIGRDGEYLGFMPPQTSPDRLTLILRKYLAK